MKNYRWAIEEYEDVQVNEWTLSGFAKLDPDWLTCLEVANYRSLVVLKHVRHILDDAVLSACTFEEAQEEVRQEATEAVRKKIVALRGRL